MAFDKAKAYLQQYGLESHIMEFDTSSATVELAAKAVGCEPARIAKTLSFKVEEQCILIVAAGDAKLTIKNTRHSFTPKQRCFPLRKLKI